MPSPLSDLLAAVKRTGEAKVAITKAHDLACRRRGQMWPEIQGNDPKRMESYLEARQDFDDAKAQLGAALREVAEKAADIDCLARFGAADLDPCQEKRVIPLPHESCRAAARREAGVE